MPKPGTRDGSRRGAERARDGDRDRVRDRKRAFEPAPEFSRPVNVSRIGRLEHRLEIAANAEERAALARRFGLAALEALGAKVILKKRGDGVVEVRGTFHARLAQPCVVTLDPVWATIDEAVKLYFSGAMDAAARGGDIDPMDDEGAPDPIVNGMIDVGEAVAQLMALALDPYPRSPGASSA